MGLTKGNYSGEQMSQGLPEGQQRQQKKATILLQMRRYLRFFWIGATIIMMIWSQIMGRDSLGMTIIGGALLGGLGYAITVGVFVYGIANWTIAGILYFKSLFGGEARL